MLASRWIRCSSILPTVLADNSAMQMYDRLTTPSVEATELASLSNKLVPHLASSDLSVLHKYRIVETLLNRSIRNERILQKCLWDIFKAPLPPQVGNDHSQLALVTSAAFAGMSQAGFTNDQQMIALALGRCAELGSQMNLLSVAKVYDGLRSFHLSYFSLTQVALYASDVTAEGTLRPSDEVMDIAGDRLANQPNLIDVVCAEMEARLIALSLEVDDGQLGKDPFGRQEVLELYATVIRAMSAVGVLSPDVLRGMRRLMSQCNSSISVEYAASSIANAVRINERIVDPLDHEDSVDLAEARMELVEFLSSHIVNQQHRHKSLTKAPETVLQLRRLCEEFPALTDLAPALWDTIRTIRVSHSRALVGTNKAPAATLLGKLSSKKYAVKVKPVTADLSGAERFIPPQFKTWRSPQHTPRGGHQPSQRQPRVAAFGTRRISKDYIKKKRKKYCPAVW